MADTISDNDGRLVSGGNALPVHITNPGEISSGGDGGGDDALVTVQGLDPSGATPSGNPIVVAGVSPTDGNLYSIGVDSLGNVRITGTVTANPAALGTTTITNPSVATITVSGSPSTPTLLIAANISRRSVLIVNRDPVRDLKVYTTNSVVTGTPALTVAAGGFHTFSTMTSSSAFYGAYVTGSGTTVCDVAEDA